MELPYYDAKEERLNTLTHAFGAVLAVVAVGALLWYVRRHQDDWVLLGSAIFGATGFLVFLSSAIYHGLRHPTAKKVFRLIDHAAIYLMIAGSYSPFALANLRDVGGWTLFKLVWVIALLGIISKILLRNHIDRFAKLDTTLYVLFGMLSLLYLREILQTISPVGVALMIIGGLLYIIGAVIYINKRIPYNHAIWHLFVIAAMGTHYFSVLWYAHPPVMGLVK